MFTLSDLKDAACWLALSALILFLCTPEWWP